MLGRQIVQDADQSPVDPVRHRAIELFERKAWAESLTHFDQIVALNPRNAEIHNYRARALEALELHQDALDSVDAALAINPQNVADLRNRGVILTKLGRLEEALKSYDAALTHRPNNPDLLVRRALTLNQIDRRQEALADITKAVELAPNDPEILNSRVIILDNLGRYTDALSDIDRMLDLKPNHLDAINNSGMILARMGRFKESLICYDRSLSIAPNQPQAKYNRSLIRLSMGDWIRGFQEFESRWDTAPLNKAKLTGLGTLWHSGDQELQGKTILVYHEQGYGDTFQCVRYVPLLAARGAKVILAVPPAIATLMCSVPGVSEVTAGVGGLPAHDYQSPLMSLPLAFRTTPDTVPANVPYLSANLSKAETWRLLGKKEKPRIGVVWRGRHYAPINYPRDVPLAALRPILQLDADFISLQNEVVDEDLATLTHFPGLRRLGERLTDFADTAALIAQLDLVITVDSAVAHLAGALGKPVWMMNRYASCWRWLQGGSNSVWYPTMRQFRQRNVGDWTSVVSDIRSATVEFLSQNTTLSKAAIEATPTPASSVSHAAHPIRSVDYKAKIRFVSATRLSHEEFFKQAALGKSLPIYRTFPKRQSIELRLFANNQEGLSTVYNIAIEEAKADPAILVFIHDDVYLSDYYWAEHLHDALRHFDLVGLAGNRRRVPRQASWMYLDGQFTRDNYDNLSGVLGHGDPFPNLRQLSVYGEPGQEVKLLDGVMMAIRSETLAQTGLRFDTQFKFHFYDMDFCRQAELKHLRMGTWAISLVHASAGTLGVDSWRAAYVDYLSKYGEA